MSTTPTLPQPYREPLWKTLRRTLTIALCITTALTLLLPREGSYRHYWATTYLAVLWFPLGGHYVELGYLNWARMVSAWVRQHRTLSRMLWWLIGGLPLGLGCWWTWGALGTRPSFDLPLWWGMPFFVVAECVVHTVLNVRGYPSFWNGRE